VFICIYIQLQYVYIHIHVNIIYMYVKINIRLCIYTCIHVNIYMSIFSYIYIHMHIFTYIYTYNTYICDVLFESTDTPQYTSYAKHETHAHTHTHTHTHTPGQQRRQHFVEFFQKSCHCPPEMNPHLPPKAPLLRHLRQEEVRQATH